MSKNGRIGVTSDNIFPIIKKFLYSDHEIFLREIVSNAVDATEKLRTLSTRGEAKGELGDLTVSVSIDSEKKTLTVSDRGVGMSSEELDRYINQIAFSGAEEFLEKYKDDKTSIIGHFGLGFYSAFMVADRVEIFSKSFREDAKGVYWVSNGDPEYTMKEYDKSERGTDIVIHINEENEEFLGHERIEALLKKYCRFLTVPIVFGKKQEWKDGKYQDTDEDNQINNTAPAWTRKPSELEEKDYDEFYHELYPMGADPLFHIHLNVDYPFNLTGILYFPKISTQLDLQRNKIQLYCNQVFVTDEIEGIVPDYLTLLHGVIDSPDIPLNVSRSYLQSDARVKKISNHITKKVADRLEEIFKSDRSTFEEKWQSLKLFVEYGMLTDEKFYDRGVKFFLLSDTDEKKFTFDEYKELVKGEQTDKDDRLVLLYADDAETQYTHIARAKEKGYSVLLMDGQLGVHIMSALEQKNEKLAFVRVDSDTTDRLIRKTDDAHVELPETDKQTLEGIFTAALPKQEKRNFQVSLAPLSASGDAITITQSEYMRRMQEMAKMQPGMSFYGDIPESYTVVLNTDSPLISRILAEAKTALYPEVETMRETAAQSHAKVEELEGANKDKKDEEIPVADKEVLEAARKVAQEADDALRNSLTEYGTKAETIKQLIDLALLGSGLLTGEPLARFIRRSESLL